MTPLPELLGDPLAGPRLAKRERTRRQLVAAAIRVFAARGVADATVQEIATVAEVTAATVYNHFRTKDEIVQAVALWIIDAFCRRISESYTHIPDGAERMAIGTRRYLWLAGESPAWALLLADVADAAPYLIEQMAAAPLADLRLGVRQKRFRIASEPAAMDLIMGTVGQAMRSVALRQMPAQHGSVIAAMLLRGLGMSFEEAEALVRRPLPDLPKPP